MRSDGYSVRTASVLFVETMKSLPHLRTKQGVIHPPFGLINIEFRRHHIVVADERHGRIQGKQLACV